MRPWLRLLLFALLCLPGHGGVLAAVQWTRLSSTTGDLPVPGTSTEQTGVVVADFDRDGTNDFIVSFRKEAPALVWYRPVAATATSSEATAKTRWTRTVIEPAFLTVEAGGAAFDIDDDGDTDVVFGGDWQSNELWWWENPGPPWDGAMPWKRRTIKSSGARQHHDQVFADILGTGKPQLVFWNQGARKIFLAEIPADPRNESPWPLTEVFSGAAGESGRAAYQYPEGMSAFDIDADGRLDLLAGNLWLKHTGDRAFVATRIGTVGGLIFAGRFKPGKYPQVIIAPGDGTGPLRLYECTGDPLTTADWIGKDLLPRDVIHGHSLQLGDIDRDGHLDIFTAEMAKWSKPDRPDDNPGATAWVLYGNGRGSFRTETLSVGTGFHEARLSDLNGDGRLDILNKPYTWKAPRIDLWLQRAR